MRMLLITLTAFALLAGGAHAGEVSLRDTVTDGDGVVTFGDLFDGAGAASDMVVARREAASVVLDASSVQLAASRAGLYWSNPRGLRRIIVRTGGDARPASDRQEDRPSGPAVIRAGDMVTVRWSDGGLSLSLDARASTAAAAGQPVTLINPTSKKTIEAVATGPGRALAGPAAQAARLAALPTPLQR